MYGAIVGTDRMSYGKFNQGWSTNGLKNIKKETKGVFTSRIKKIDEAAEYSRMAEHQINQNSFEYIRKYPLGVNQFRTVNRQNLTKAQMTNANLTSKPSEPRNPKFIPLNVKSPVDMLPISRSKYETYHVSSQKSKKGNIEQTRIIKGATTGCNNSNEFKVVTRPIKTLDIGLTGIDINDEDVKASTKFNTIETNGETTINQIPNYTETKTNSQFSLPDIIISITGDTGKKECTANGDISNYSERIENNLTDRISITGNTGKKECTANGDISNYSERIENNLTDRISITGYTGKKQIPVFNLSDNHFEITNEPTLLLKDVKSGIHQIFKKDITYNSEITCDVVREKEPNSKYKREDVKITSDGFDTKQQTELRPKANPNFCNRGQVSI